MSSIASVKRYPNRAGDCRRLESSDNAQSFKLKYLLPFRSGVTGKSEALVSATVFPKEIISITTVYRKEILLPGNAVARMLAIGIQLYFWQRRA